MMACAKRIYILIIKAKKLFFLKKKFFLFFSLLNFLKEIDNMFSVFLLSYRNTHRN